MHIGPSSVGIQYRQQSEVPDQGKIIVSHQHLSRTGRGMVVVLNRREVDEWTRNIWNREHIDLENNWEIGGHRCVLVNKFCQSIPLPSSLFC